MNHFINKKFKTLLLFTLLFGLGGGCQFNDISDPDLQWNSEFLLPLLVSDIPLQDAANLTDLVFTEEVKPNDLNNIPGTSFFNGVPEGVAVNLPPFKLSSVGPYQSEITEYFTRIEADSVNFSTRIENPFPINIKAGTRVVFRTSANTSSPDNIFYEDTITADVETGGVIEFNVITGNKTVTSDYFLYLEDFQSDGGQAVVFQSGKPIKIEFEIKFIKLGRAFAKINKNNNVTDTSEIEISEEENPEENDGTALDLGIYIDNQFPIAYTVQMYFLATDRTTVIDSVFANGGIKVIGAQTDGNGNVLQYVSDSAIISFDSQRYNKIEQAAYMVTNFYGNTFPANIIGNPPGPTVVANGQNSLVLQLTGDINLRVKANND